MYKYTRDDIIILTYVMESTTTKRRKAKKKKRKKSSLRPRTLIITRDLYVDTFSTSRKHMRKLFAGMTDFFPPYCVALLYTRRATMIRGLYEYTTTMSRE